MFSEFRRWWLGQLADLVPEKWRGFGSRDADATIIAPPTPLTKVPQTVTVSLRRKGREAMLGLLRLGRDVPAELSRLAGKPAVLLLAENDVLTKTLVLPLAAEPQLSQVLAFEMDRETPFAADELFWGYRVLRRDRKAGQLVVRLSMLPREKLLGLLNALGNLGITPWRAEVAAGSAVKTYLPLEAGGQHDPVGRRLLRPVLISFAALLITALMLPFAHQSWMLASVENTIAAERSGASDAEKLRREIERLSGSTDLVEIERRRGGRPLAILAALTRLLPADTYLTDFAQQNGRVTLTGRSAGASRLIAILDQGTLLRNPAFAAPVTRVAADQSEVFTIKAEVVP